MPQNSVIYSRDVYRSKAPVNSARQAADVLELAVPTLVGAVNSGWILNQAPQGQRIAGKRVFAFDPSYLSGIKPLLGKKRGPGVSVFTEEVIQRLKEFNESWLKKS